MALAMQREQTTYRSVLMLGGAALADLEPMDLPAYHYCRYHHGLHC